MISFYCPVRIASVLSFLACVTKLRQHLPLCTKLVITRELLASLGTRKGEKREDLETRDICHAVEGKYDVRTEEPIKMSDSKSGSV